MAKKMPAISTRVARLRPMYCARMPSGNRISAPAKIGMDSIMPIWVGESWKLSRMNGAIAPLMTHTAQEKPKYRNDAHSVGAWPDLRNSLK